MSSVTSLTPLPYPDPTDQPFVHLDLKALAEQTTESLFVASATAPAHKLGRRWARTSDGAEFISDGTAWRALHFTTAQSNTVHTYGSGWGAYTSGGWNGVQIQRAGDLITINGAANKGSAIGAAEVVLTVPVGWRPAQNVQGYGGAPGISGAVPYTLSAAGALTTGLASSAGAVSFSFTYFAAYTAP